MEVIEFALPQFMPNFEFEVASVEEMGATHGLTYPQESKIILREDIYEGAIEGVGRDRMTVAHEIGHLLMHKNIAFARAEPGLAIRAFESSEWQAKCFSGELLVPTHFADVLRDMSVEQIAKECGVSCQAADYQKELIKKP
jgi:Zn-dependent peptidase ImmA (M78 family)